MKDNKNLGNVKKSPVLKHKSPKISHELPQTIPSLPLLSHNLYGIDKNSQQKVMIFDEFSTEALPEVDGSVTSRYQPVQTSQDQPRLRKFKKLEMEKQNGTRKRNTKTTKNKLREKSQRK